MKLTLATTVLCLVLAMPTWAGFKEGSDAYDRGDYATAMREWHPLAEQGHVIAQKNLGVIYRQGRGVERNYAEAIKWYRKAADAGNAKAQFSLGLMYHEAQGVSQNYTQAAKWYRKAAEQGVKLAQYNLGLMYYEGKGVPRNFTEAYRWWAMRETTTNTISTPTATNENLKASLR